jgi:hypothetical protein
VWLPDVLGELRLRVVEKQQWGEEWIFHIARESFTNSPDLPLPPEGGSIAIYSGTENQADTFIYEEEVEAIRRRFRTE